MDKDFDDLLGIKRTDLTNLFYLERYSIENYLFEENAILLLLISQMPTTNRNKLRFNYNNIVKKIIKTIKPIACCFYVTHKNKIPGLKSVSQPLEVFLCQSDDTKFDKIKVTAYKKQICLGLRAQNKKVGYMKEMEIAKQEIEYNTEKVFNHLPGKHCILLLLKILRHKYSKLGNQQLDKASYLLASNATFLELDPIINKINQYLSQISK